MTLPPTSQSTAGHNSGQEVVSPIATVTRLGPPRRVTLPSGDIGYLVTRHADALAVLADPTFSRAETTRPGRPKYFVTPLEGRRSLLDMDPPEHTRVRAMVSNAFTRSRVDALRPRITQAVDQLLSAMTDAGSPADLVETLCAPLPIMVICEMLGIPYGDRASFRAATETIVSADTLPPDQVAQAAGELQRYIATLITAKRATPTEDLLSTLVTGNDPDDELTESEMINLLGVLLIAGHETTLNQLARSVHALLSDSSLYTALVAEPAEIPSAVEELLRLHPAVPGPGHRITTRDVEIGGVAIPAGNAVVVSAATANRDPDIFDDPEGTALRRINNGHLTFGHGLHFCLGAALARAELDIALTGLVTRFSTLRFAGDPSTIPWGADFISGPQVLPVAW